MPQARPPENGSNATTQAHEEAFARLRGLKQDCAEAHDCLRDIVAEGRLSPKDTAAFGRHITALDRLVSGVLDGKISLD